MAVSEADFAVLTARVDDHDRRSQDSILIQQYILGRLDTINGVLVEHTQVLAEHGIMLADHGRQLAEHGRQLAEHGVRLDRIEVRLDRIETTQVEHSERLASIERKVDALPRVLAEIIKADRQSS